LSPWKSNGFLGSTGSPNSDGEVVDGRARQACRRGLRPEDPNRGVPARTRAGSSGRRDTPLNRVAVAIDSNRARLDDGISDLVHNEVSALPAGLGRTAADLAITVPWRKIVPKDYVPMLDVDACRSV